jgi:hypothetical protein
MCCKELDKRFAVIGSRKVTKQARVEATVLNSLTPISKADDGGVIGKALLCNKTLRLLAGQYCYVHRLSFRIKIRDPETVFRHHHQKQYHIPQGTQLLLSCLFLSPILRKQNLF